jgi:uracil-DNA glycosylase
MILGHDFHSEAGYEESLRNGMESESQPTWENLTKVLRRAKISPEDCFFTNAYLGLRKGTKTTGPFPGRLHPGFCEYCKSFLLTQISTQRPTLIITLGVYVPEFLAPLSPQLHQWSTKRGLKHLDTIGPVKTRVTFEQLPGFATTVVALTHPSMRGSNLRHRRYGELAGDAAEMQMLSDATRFAKDSARGRSAR